MDTILICRDALINSLIGCIGKAIANKKAGYDVGIIFTNEALAALGGMGVFGWSPLFKDRLIKSKITKKATSMGIEIADGKDSRWTNIPRALQAVKAAGINLYACPLWTEILGVGKSLPSEVTIIESDDLLKKMQDAKMIIGGL